MANLSNGIIRDILNREGDTDTGRPTEYRGCPVTPDEVAALTRAEAYSIYNLLYIDKSNFDHIDDQRLHELMADSGVQHGSARAVRWLQRAAGVKDDGFLGPITLAAISAANSVMLYLRVLATRIRFYGQLISTDYTQAVNAAGWANRVSVFVEDKTLWKEGPSS